MEKKDNMVFLIVGDHTQSFELEHAERILKMKNNGGWKLPKDSNFIFDKANGLTHKRNKGNTKKEGKGSGN